jgi:aminobenzoyl-glutamate transport protein
MIASTMFLTVIITVVCERIVEPRLGAWKPDGSGSGDVLTQQLSTSEQRGLRWASITFVLGLGVLALLTIPDQAVLRDSQGSLKPLEQSIVVILMLLFLVSGIVYAVVTRAAKTDKELATMAGDGMATMGGYIVLSFVMAQFIFYFKWSNLGIIIAVNGANLLKSLSLEGPFLLTAFVLVAAAINLLVASASAKWAIMAPVFIPMFMLMGISPEATQLAYRIGDSSTNMIAPLLGYVPLIIVAMQRYKKDAGFGTLVSLMLPYSVTIIVLWTLMLLVWVWLGIDIGPGVSAQMP